MGLQNRRVNRWVDRWVAFAARRCRRFSSLPLIVVASDFFRRRSCREMSAIASSRCRCCVASVVRAGSSSVSSSPPVCAAAAGGAFRGASPRNSTRASDAARVARLSCLRIGTPTAEWPTTTLTHVDRSASFISPTLLMKSWTSSTVCSAIEGGSLRGGGAGARGIGAPRSPDRQHGTTCTATPRSIAVQAAGDGGQHVRIFGIILMRKRTRMCQ